MKVVNSRVLGKKLEEIWYGKWVGIIDGKVYKSEGGARTWAEQGLGYVF